MTITGNFERFQYFIFEGGFMKNKIFSKKLESRFLVESTTTESATFPYKTALQNGLKYIIGKTAVSNCWKSQANIL